MNNNITYEAVMQRLQVEGYENVHGDGRNQIIVNNRGEIEFFSFEDQPTTAKLFDRLTPGYGNHFALPDIDMLFADISFTWTKEEPK